MPRKRGEKKAEVSAAEVINTSNNGDDEDADIPAVPLTGASDRDGAADGNRGPGSYIPSQSDPFVAVGGKRPDPIKYVAEQTSAFQEYGVRSNIQESDVGVFVRVAAEEIELFGDDDIMADAMYRKGTLGRAVGGKAIEQIVEMVIAEKRQNQVSKLWNRMRGQGGQQQGQGAQGAGTEL